MVIRFNLLVMETLFVVKVLSLAPGHSLCIYLLRSICSACSVLFFGYTQVRVSKISQPMSKIGSVGSVIPC